MDAAISEKLQTEELKLSFIMIQKQSASTERLYYQENKVLIMNSFKK